MEFLKFNENISINIFQDVNKLNRYMPKVYINEFNKGLCLVSGGETPKKIYQTISKIDDKYYDRKILLCDERLVDDNDCRSNYKMLIDNLEINYCKNFPISYQKKINSIGLKNLQYELDFILKKNILSTAFLGIGKDGHTASLFPNMSKPNTKQGSFKVYNHNDNYSRFTLSIKSILKFKKIIFIAAGINKNQVIKSFFEQKVDFEKNPFHEIALNHKNVVFYLDKNAFKNINL